MERGEEGFSIHPRRNKSIETSQTISEGLPALQAGRGEKANVLRNQLNDTKSQIMLMEAKLRNLRQLKDRNELKNQRNLTRIEWMNGVKLRVRSEQEHKQKLKQERSESLQTLKQETGAIRQALVNERRNAEAQMMAVRNSEAEEERRRHKQHQYLIRRLREMDGIEKGKKVERIKEFHETSTSRLRDFQDSRVNASKNNYQHKVAATLQEKERARNLLEQLRIEEEKLLADVKNSEQTILSNLYGLEGVNPERRRAGSEKGKLGRGREGHSPQGVEE